MDTKLMVGIESVCVLFMLIILSAYLILPRNRERGKDWFLCSLVLTIAGLAVDLVSWICETFKAPAVLQYSSNFLAQIMTSLIVAAFAYYTVDQICPGRSVPMKVAHIIAAVNAVGVLVAVAAAVSGNLFDIQQDPDLPDVLIYESGGLFYDLPAFLASLSFLFLFLLTLHYGRELGRRKCAVFTLFFALPLIASAIEVIDDNYLLSYVSISMAMSILYVMIQSSQVNELLIRDEVLNEFSYLDSLTGLQNRRACDRDIGEIRDDDSVHIAFCDLNGLKRINDEKGHVAGDEFLILFSKILTGHFPHEAVYRISGDEFLVIDRSADEDAFNRNIADLRAEISENAGIAALGTISGTGSMVPELMKRAEISMYDDKKAFYRNNPAYNRGKSAYMNADV